MHNYRSNQSALMTRFGTDLRHQYGIFGGKSQTSFTRNATRAGSEEGRLFSQAILKAKLHLLTKVIIASFKLFLIAWLREYCTFSEQFRGQLEVLALAKIQPVGN